MFLLLKHRQVLLEIFSKNYRVRRNLIQSRLTQECGEDLSKQEVDKVLKVRGYLLCHELGVGGWWCGRARSAAFPAPWWWREVCTEAHTQRAPAPPSKRI